MLRSRVCLIGRSLPSPANEIPSKRKREVSRYRSEIKGETSRENFNFFFFFFSFRKRERDIWYIYICKDIPIVVHSIFRSTAEMEVSQRDAIKMPEILDIFDTRDAFRYSRVRIVDLWRGSASRKVGKLTGLRVSLRVWMIRQVEE